MNVVFLSRLFYPHIGGVEVHSERVAEELIKKGYQVTVITEQYDHSLNLSEIHDEISIIRIPYHLSGSKTGTWKWFSQNKDILLKADIIHVHDVFWWLIPLKLTSDIKVFTTFHGWEGHFPPKNKAKIIRKISEKLSEANICVGDFIPKWYGTSANVITYGATDFSSFESPGAKNQLLVYGRLSKDNDMGLVLEGLKIIKDALPKIHITFLGDGEFSWQAKEIGNVLGFQDNIKSHLENGHWVITSSYLSILDAVASSRKVFSVYSNDLKKDYLEMHPISKGLEIAGSPEMLADKFISNYKRYKEHSRERNPYEKWAQKQTWDKLAQQYINLWQDTSYTFAYQKITDELNEQTSHD